MYYKKKKYHKRKPKYKIKLISLDDPKVRKMVEKKLYEEYLRKANYEDGDNDG